MFIFSKYYKETLGVAIPVILSYLIDMISPFLNTYLAAKINNDSIAAISLANSTFISFMGFGWGVINAVGVITSKKIGANKYINTGIVFKSGIIISILIGLVINVILLGFKHLWIYFEIDPNLVKPASEFLVWLSIASIPDIIKYCLLQYAISFGRTMIPIVCSIAQIIICFLLNYGLAFGKFGLPYMGIAGLGAGTAISLWVVAFATFIYIYLDKDLGANIRKNHKIKLYLYNMQKLLTTGIPMGIMFSIEIIFLMFEALMIAKISKDALAAYQITSQWEWVVMILTYGFTESIMILVSKAYGAQDFKMIKAYYKDGMAFAMICSFIGVILFILIPDLMVSLDIDINAVENHNIVYYAKKIFMYLCLIKVLESFRVIISSVLRALNFANYPMYLSLIMFWIIGLPLCYFLAFSMKMQVDGIFIGVTIILLIIAILLYKKLGKIFDNIEQNFIDKNSNVKTIKQEKF